MKKGEVFYQPLVVMVLVAISQLALSGYALADSPRSWGYWDAAPAAGPSTQRVKGYSQLTSSEPTTDASDNQNGEQINTTQNITGLQRGSVRSRQSNQASTLKEAVTPVVVVPEIPYSDYIAYFECKTGCDGDDLSISKVGFNLESVNDINVNQRFGSTALNQTTTYEVGLSATGLYDGQAFHLTDDAATIRHFETFSFDGNFREQVIVSTTSGANSLSGRAGSFSDVTGIATINTEQGSGQAVWGKGMVASEIQAQMRIGQSYRFSGRSTHASVEMSVDFQNASWNGSWITSGSGPHNGFTAGGGFTKAGTLKSNFVNGSGTVGIDGFVKSGVVDASLTQAIHGAANGIGVVGQSNLEVIKNGGTQRVIENFSARQN